MRYSRTWLAFRYANRCVYFGWAALLGIFCLMFLPWFLATLAHDIRLSIWGRSATAIVVAKQPGPGGKRPNTQVHYTFTVDGQNFRGQISVPPGEANAMEIGQAIDIAFLPTNPAENRARFPIWRSIALIPVLIGTVAAGLSLWCFIQGVRDIASRVRLIAYGTPALGRILAVEIAEGRRRASYVKRLNYYYDVGQSSRRIDVDQTDLTELGNYLPRDLRIGEVILVIHDPEKPERHEIDRFDARRSDRQRLLDELQS